MLEFKRNNCGLSTPFEQKFYNWGKIWFQCRENFGTEIVYPTANGLFVYYFCKFSKNRMYLIKIFKLSNPKILGAPGASCGRFSITYSRSRFLFPFGGQMGFSKWLIMTNFSHPGKKYNRSCLLSLENNSRHANEGARATFGFESLKMFISTNL